MTIDAFDTLGIQPRFAMKPAELDARHRDLGRALHPDRFAGAPAPQRRRALNEAIGVNHAYRALKDPLERAALLASRVRRALGSPNHVEPPQPSASFLMAVMESREELATARRQRDRATATRIGDEMAERQAALLAQLEQAYDSGSLRELVSVAPTQSSNPDAIAIGVQQLEHAEALANELRYVRRFLDEVAAMHDDLDDGA